MPKKEIRRYMDREWELASVEADSPIADMKQKDISNSGIIILIGAVRQL